MKPAARVAAVALSVMAGGAGAYILPGASILKELTRRRDEQKLFTLRIDGSASFTGGEIKEAGPALGLPTDRPELQVDATVYLKLPTRCRFELSSAEGGKQVASVVANGKKRFEGADLSAVSEALQQVCALLAQRSSGESEAKTAIEHYLKSLGVKEEATSLARFQGQLAFVLGEVAEDKPQAWFYKENYMPARVRFTDAQGTAWDVLLIDYTSPATGDWFPRTIEVYRGGELELRFTGLKSDARTGIPDRLF